MSTFNLYKDLIKDPEIVSVYPKKYSLGINGKIFLEYIGSELIPDIDITSEEISMWEKALELVNKPVDVKWLIYLWKSYLDEVCIQSRNYLFRISIRRDYVYYCINVKVYENNGCGLYLVTPYNIYYDDAEKEIEIECEKEYEVPNSSVDCD